MINCFLFKLESSMLSKDFVPLILSVVLPLITTSASVSTYTVYLALSVNFSELTLIDKSLSPSPLMAVTGLPFLSSIVLVKRSLSASDSTLITLITGLPSSDANSNVTLSSDVARILKPSLLRSKNLYNPCEVVSR